LDAGYAHGGYHDGYSFYDAYFVPLTTDSSGMSRDADCPQCARACARNAMACRNCRSSNSCGERPPLGPEVGLNIWGYGECFSKCCKKAECIACVNANHNRLVASCNDFKGILVTFCRSFYRTALNGYRARCDKCK
jgi:hypothetical protein